MRARVPNGATGVLGELLVVGQRRDDAGLVQVREPFLGAGLVEPFRAREQDRLALPPRCQLLAKLRAAGRIDIRALWSERGARDST